MICPKDSQPCTGQGLLSRQECIERCRAERGLEPDQSAFVVAPTMTCPNSDAHAVHMWGKDCSIRCPGKAAKRKWWRRR